MDVWLLLLVKVALIFVILLPVTMLSKRFDPSKPIVVIIVALGGLFINLIVDFTDQRISTPSVEVTVKKERNELLVGIAASKPLEVLSLDLPVLGKIINIHDNNSVTEARTSLKKIVGSNTSTSQNNIEFYIENIKPKTRIEYKILYEPIPSNMFIAGTDSYKVSYSWYYGGKQITISKWFSIATGQEVKQPNAVVKGGQFYNRALSPEEIKKRYEEGLRERKVE
ncbi:MAG: hypothetical protein CVU71_12285 [Deltaproteobacteria bacterium HGW-Deltaproteobacteria-6]|jgi:hypothetical protein|nr:MAG: hypothetical protein CVU71_12285 [Deltaproteobacteria bacterium HGW-Deltaproteobacteria-6]